MVRFFKIWIVSEIFRFWRILSTFDRILINSGTWRGYAWHRLMSGGPPAASESEIALARANLACLCALQPYNYVGNNPRPRSSRGSRAGPIEISKILQNPRFSSFLPPRAPTATYSPHGGNPSDLAPRLGVFIGSRPKNIESAPGARENHRGKSLAPSPLRRDHTRAAGPVQAAPGV